jgi:hypothetical protein
MPAAGSATNQVHTMFYAEDDRVSVPKVIQVETESRTATSVITKTEQTQSASSRVELFTIR